MILIIKARSDGPGKVSNSTISRNCAVMEYFTGRDKLALTRLSEISCRAAIKYFGVTNELYIILIWKM